jgi:hypothetical protein
VVKIEQKPSIKKIQKPASLKGQLDQASHNAISTIRRWTEKVHIFISGCHTKCPEDLIFNKPEIFTPVSLNSYAQQVI